MGLKDKRRTKIIVFETTPDKYLHELAVYIPFHFIPFLIIDLIKESCPVWSSLGMIWRWTGKKCLMPCFFSRSFTLSSRPLGSQYRK